MPNDVIIVGAGPAGIAAGLELQRVGIEPLLLEQDRIASTWRGAYNSLHLNTHRRPSSLPGLAMPRSLGSHPAASSYAGYLEQAARGLDIRLGAAVERVDRQTDSLVVHLSSGTSLTARHVVVATGAARQPRWPDVPDIRQFPGLVMHASDFVDGSVGQGLNVVVIGGGNSAADIAVDLVDAGVGSVALSVRRPPQVVPRSLGPIPIQAFGGFVSRLPGSAGDHCMRVVRRLWLGELACRGLPAPSSSLADDHASGTIPIVDHGFARAVRRERIQVVGEVVDIGPFGLRLRDGTVLHPDLVVAATGYSSGLADIVGHLGVVDSAGSPLGDGHPRDLDGLWFLGFNDPLSGQLRQISIDARSLARQLSRQMEDAHV